MEEIVNTMRVESLPLQRVFLYKGNKFSKQGGEAEWSNYKSSVAAFEFIFHAYLNLMAMDPPPSLVSATSRKKVFIYLPKECIIGTPRSFCVGVCEPSKASLDGQLSDRKRTWAISSKAAKRDLKKGDTIGLAYDLSDIRPVLKMYLNGKVAKILKCNGDMHGDVYPCVSVAGGCMLEANFEGSLHEFQYGPPQGYCGIMYTRDIL
eukprot:jgi/Bigna1/132183/aug1.16_g6891